MIKFSSEPKVEIKVTFSDGTSIKRESLDDISLHLENKIRGYHNQIEFYSKELMRLKVELASCERDIKDFMEILNSSEMDKSDV